MTNKKRPGFGQNIMRIVLLATNLFGFASNLTALLKYETHMAGKSLAKIVVLSLLIVMFLSCIWLCLLAMLLVYLISLQFSLIAAISIMLGINLLLVFIVTFMLCKARRVMFFPITREQFSNIFEP